MVPEFTNNELSLLNSLATFCYKMFVDLSSSETSSPTLQLSTDLLICSDGLVTVSDRKSTILDRLFIFLNILDIRFYITNICLRGCGSNSNSNSSNSSSSDRLMKFV